MATCVTEAAEASKARLRKGLPSEQREASPVEEPTMVNLPNVSEAPKLLEAWAIGPPAQSMPCTPALTKGFSFMPYP